MNAIGLTETKPPAGRKVRLASVHFRPSGKSPQANCQEFAPLIAEAAGQKADLIVLGETLTFYGTGKTYAECAEPVPGPSTNYFGQLARKHNLYIVAGLLERDRHLIYNVAVLLGPDGKMVGKYRKVCLPRGEIAGGIAPGKAYPVFSTRFGKLGIMVCYDGFFPEVARELDADRGLRPRRQAAGEGREVGERDRRRSRPRPTSALEQPWRFQGGAPAASAGDRR